jgi:homoserine kinase type II
MPTLTPPADVLFAAAGRWGVKALRLRPDRELAGSPERCESRAVVEDTAGELHVLERLGRGALPRKLEIFLALEGLAEQGLGAIHPYRRSRRGEAVVEAAGAFWQLRPYVAGVPLERPAYMVDAWRGEEIAGFLLGLRRASNGLPLAAGAASFALDAYIDGLLRALRPCRPAVAAAVEPLIRRLGSTLFAGLARLPPAFAHGDLHPLNVIWSTEGIRSVIDWEFCGPKPVLYDAANLMGCLGFEDPAGLRGPMALAFLDRLRAADFASPAAWGLFPELLLAVRFGWLAEWLRKRDEEMLQLELAYLRLLAGGLDRLAGAWAVPEAGA